MTEKDKIKQTHLSRSALIYIRQSTATQVERNRESTDRQYRLVERALELGWRRHQIIVIDEDLGCSGSGTVERLGFNRMASDVGLGQIGIVISLEASRLARNNSDWYHLLDLAGMTDTLIADTDGVYHPRDFNDRLLLGLKGTMSEAELHLIRARLIGGIKNKAARGKLRCSLPVGYVWSEDGEEVQLHPNEAITGAIRSVFERFAELRSARQVWLWFYTQGLQFPKQHRNGQIEWVQAKNWQFKEILTNPAYAGVYAYGKTRRQGCVDNTGRIRYRVQYLPQDEWQVFIRDHHEGFIDWETYKVIQERLRNNFVAHPHEVDGPVREGQAMLQGLATCGRCGRRLHVHYNGQKSSPGYHCPHTVLIDDKATNCLRVGGRQIDEAVVKVFLAEMNPAGIEAAITAETMLEEQRDVSTEQWHLEVERFQYEAEKAERRYRAVEPENRLVARGLESEWEKCLRKLSTAEAELVTREKIRPRELTTEQKDKLKELSLDIGKVWSASTTTDRDRKELLRTVIEEVNIKLEPELKADLTVRWRGGAISELNIELNRRHVPALRTDEDTIELVRRLAQHYPDQVIAGILSRQHRLTATGARFTKYSVNALRRYWKIAKFEPQAVTDKGELVPISKAAEILGIPTSTLHRYVTEGFVVGEQLTPGAPWQISITDELRSRFTDEEVEGFVSIKKAVSVLSVTRQTIMQKIKRGDLQAIYMRHGRQRELRIKIPSRADSDSGQLNLL